MNSNFQLKNAGGFDRWRRAITEKAALLLTEDLLETENDEVEDPYSNIRSHLPSDNATTQEIALWEARERQFILIHNRTQQLLEYMVQLIEPTLYERVVTTNYLKRRTPTMLYRAVKKTLGPSSKSAETELHVRIDKLENSTKHPILTFGLIAGSR